MINDNDPLLVEIGLGEKVEPRPPFAANVEMKKAQMKKVESKLEAAKKK
jgi:hypothetical protein